MSPLLLAAAAAVQPGPVDHLREIVVEAIRNCPKPIAGELVVCAKDTGVAPPYRLPKLDPRYAREARNGPPGPPTVGASGTGSCSAVGAGGGSGCALRDADLWSAERRRRREEGEFLP